MLKWEDALGSESALQLTLSVHRSLGTWLEHYNSE